MPTRALGSCSFVVGTLALASLVACGDSSGPVGPASVAVTSPIDTILDVGATPQLTATARDADGNTVTGVSFTWQSSNGSVVAVSAAGVATAQGVGSAAVTATAGSAIGTLRLRVVDADLAGVIGLGGDAFVGALVAALTTATSTDVQAALTACATAATSGNIVALTECLADLRAEAASATDPTDRALLAVLSLFADEIERRLSL